jgi:uncharacterized protein YlzI (FlbEa/FlbD family)
MLISFVRRNGHHVHINPSKVLAIEPSTYYNDECVIRMENGEGYSVVQTTYEVVEQINKACQVAQETNKARAEKESEK